VNPPFASALSQWLPLVSALVIFGTGAAALLCDRDAEWPRDGPVSPRLEKLWTLLAVIAVLSTPLAVLFDVARMAGVPVRAAFPLLGEVLWLTHAGRMWLWRIALVIGIFIAAIAAPRGSRLKKVTLCVLAAGTLAADCMAGHAIDRGVIAVAACVAHLLAAALWTGALLTLLYRADGSAIERMAPRISRIAAWSAAVLVASGGYLAWRALGLDPKNLIYSSYGRTLVAKAALFTLIVFVGGYNRYWLLPGMAKASARRALIFNVGVESALLFGATILAAVLANTPPPH
jgi:putative copper resistance protein D